MRFKVPQNIDMQDRILGPLTMVQFVYAVIGFGVCYIAGNSIPAPFSYVIIVPIALFIICLDFVKINERPFLDFLKSAIVYMSSPRQRFWHEGEDSDLSIEIYRAHKEQQADFQRKNISEQEIAEFAKKIDTGNNQTIKS